MMLAHYTFEESSSTNYAIINAADFTGLSSSSDITGAEAIKVVGVAELAGVSENALGSAIGGYNFTATKTSGLEGA